MQWLNTIDASARRSEEDECRVQAGYADTLKKIDGKWLIVDRTRTE
jgi:hypothetical protein